MKTFLVKILSLSTSLILKNPMSAQIPSSAIVIPQLIVGLGNPEPKYDQTRHNIGFAAIDLLSRTWQIPLSEQRKFQGSLGEGLAVAGRKVRLLKPSTYMNRSGQSIRAVIDWFKIAPESVLVIYDEMDLPLGKVRLRLSGSAGGHNGMKSTIAHLGTQTFPRLRIGIGKPVHQTALDEPATISHVLGRFSHSETPLITQVMDSLVLGAMNVTLKEGFEKAMNLYNNQGIQ
jgi:peptidyl-tRNA hydrolase, PTH1 family